METFQGPSSWELPALPWGSGTDKSGEGGEGGGRPRGSGVFARRFAHVGESRGGMANDQRRASVVLFLVRTSGLGRGRARTVLLWPP